MEVGREKATYPQCLSLHGVGGFGEVVRLSDLMQLDRRCTAHSRPLRFAVHTHRSPNPEDALRPFVSQCLPLPQTTHLG